jgi:hypothetical protein
VLVPPATNTSGLPQWYKQYRRWQDVQDAQAEDAYADQEVIKVLANATALTVKSPVLNHTVSELQSDTQNISTQVKALRHDNKYRDARVLDTAQVARERERRKRERQARAWGVQGAGQEQAEWDAKDAIDDAQQLIDELKDGVKEADERRVKAAARYQFNHDVSGKDSGKKSQTESSSASNAGKAAGSAAIVEVEATPVDPQGCDEQGQDSWSQSLQVASQAGTCYKYELQASIVPHSPSGHAAAPKPRFHVCRDADSTSLLFDTFHLVDETSQQLTDASALSEDDIPSFTQHADGSARFDALQDSATVTLLKTGLIRALAAATAQESPVATAEPLMVATSTPKIVSDTPSPPAAVPSSDERPASAVRAAIEEGQQLLRAEAEGNSVEEQPASAEQVAAVEAIDTTEPPHSAAEDVSGAAKDIASAVVQEMQHMKQAEHDAVHSTSKAESTERAESKAAAAMEEAEAASYDAAALSFHAVQAAHQGVQQAKAKAVAKAKAGQQPEPKSVEQALAMEAQQQQEEEEDPPLVEQEATRPVQVAQPDRDGAPDGAPDGAAASESSAVGLAALRAASKDEARGAEAQAALAEDLVETKQQAHHLISRWASAAKQRMHAAKAQTPEVVEAVQASSQMIESARSEVKHMLKQASQATKQMLDAAHGAAQKLQQDKEQPEAPQHAFPVRSKAQQRRDKDVVAALSAHLDAKWAEQETTDVESREPATPQTRAIAGAMLQTSDPQPPIPGLSRGLGSKVSGMIETAVDRAMEGDVLMEDEWMSSRRLLSHDASIDQQRLRDIVLRRIVADKTNEVINNINKKTTVQEETESLMQTEAAVPDVLRRIVEDKTNEVINKVEVKTTVQEETTESLVQTEAAVPDLVSVEPIVDHAEPEQMTARKVTLRILCK